MNEEVFITALKRSNVILIDELYDLFISKQKVKEAYIELENKIMKLSHLELINIHIVKREFYKSKKELGIK